MTLDEMVAALAEHGFVQKADMLDLQGANVAVGDIRGHYTEVNSGEDGLGPSKRWGFRAEFERRNPEAEADGLDYISVELAPEGGGLRIATIEYMMMLSNHVEPARVEAALRKASGVIVPTCADGITIYVVMREDGLVGEDCGLTEVVTTYTLGVDMRQHGLQPTDIAYRREHQVHLDDEGLAEFYAVTLHGFEHSWPAMQAAKDGDEWEVPVPEFEVDL